LAHLGGLRGVAQRTLFALSLCALLPGCVGGPKGPGFDPSAVGPSLDLLRLGDELFAERKYDEAKRMYARAASANGPRHAYVEACAQVARMESLTGSLEQGEPWLELGFVRAGLDEPLGWSRLQLVVGIFERESGERAAAVERFEVLYAYCLAHELYQRAIDVAHHVVLASEDLQQQMEWSQKGIEAAEAGGLQGWLAVLWNNKGAALEDQGRWEDALLAYETARDYHRQTGNPTRILIADWAVARALRMTGRLAQARELSEATHATACERYADEPSPANAEWVGYTRWELAELDALDGSLEKAHSGLLRVRVELVEAGIESWGGFGLAELAKLDARLEELGVEPGTTP
jgi:tetratricopeptide (TPR) repeat protein